MFKNVDEPHKPPWIHQKQPNYKITNPTRPSICLLSYSVVINICLYLFILQHEPNDIEVFNKLLLLHATDQERLNEIPF